MDEWKADRTATESGVPARDRLDSWKDIAQYLNRDVRTVQRWEKSEGLPVHRLTGNRQKGSPVYAFASEIDAWLHKNPPSVEESEPGPLPESGASPRSGRFVWGILLFAILLVAAIWGWRISRSQVSGPTMRAIPLTALPGVERYPAFSPDGKQIAFSWNGEKQDNADLYVKYLDELKPRRLTTDTAVDGWPIWSPDGRSIAFGRWMRGSKTGDIMVISLADGAERKIHEFPLPYQAANYWPPGCWTRDGKWLVVSVAPAAIGLVSPDTGEPGPVLTEPEAGSVGDYGPALSPDERSLAFLRASSGPVWNLYIQRLGPDYVREGPPRQLTQEPAGVENPMWTKDGREILFIANREGERALFRIPCDGSKPASRVPTTDKVGYFWTISKNGDRLAYADNKWNPDIWRIDLEGEMEPRPIQASTREDSNPQISPDGTRVAFLSGQERGMRLWVSDADGSNPIDLAAVNGKRVGPARWSPDGSELVFECRENDRDDICAVPSRAGPIRSLTRSPGRYTLPSWSGDGKWIYVTTNRSGSFQIWKIPSDGSENGARPLTKRGGYAAVESEDGRTVYFSREMMASGLWSVPADGGEETRIGDFKVNQCYMYALCPDGVYYAATENPEQSFELWFYRFSSGRSEHIRRVKMRLESGMSLSPEGRYLLFTAAREGTSDLMMIENFR